MSLLEDVRTLRDETRTADGRRALGRVVATIDGLRTENQRLREALRAEGVGAGVDLSDASDVETPVPATPEEP